MKIGRLLDDTARLVQRCLERTFLPATAVLAVGSLAQISIPALGLSGFPALVTVVAVGLAATAFAQSLVVEDVRRARSGEPEGLRLVARGAIRPARTLMGAQTLIAISVGLIAVICLFFAAVFVAGSSRRTTLVVLLMALLPAAILLLNWLLVAPLVVMERRAPLESLRASSGLVEGKRWRLLLGLVVVLVAYTVFVGLQQATTGLVLNGRIESFLDYAVSQTAWVLLVTTFSTAAYLQLAGDRRSDAVGVSGEALDRWAADIDRRRGADSTFRI